MRDVDTSQISGRLLKVFITVFDEMSVSKAAAQLESSQSTISHNLEKLRSILGDTLFLQSGRGIIPSARAEVLAPKIRLLLAELEILADGSEYDPEKDRSAATIATNGSTLAPELDQVRKLIWSKIPDKKLIFRELGSRANLESVLDKGKADIAVTARPFHYPDLLVSQELFAEKSVIFYDPNFRKPIETINEYCTARHVNLDFGGSVKSVVETTLETLGLSRNIVISVPNVWFLAQTLKGTDLVATLPALLKKSAFQDLETCDLPISIPPVHFDLVWHRRYDDSARISWIRSQLTEALAPNRS
ncbi:Nodulation protein D 2 [Phaeobacter sp. CECT 5382]|uniref:LysR family transcriptional regulator n=1 Tax=Phaeobacter sp. CECT 5382 TaxID=1712645 RepID=UPI0006D9AC34|nr:LysR family transcriptional regulator [Phaeobacter sp. CECT 5382]CUH86428.1 Nodulation protein D 2 [Phaeobacter sp. CECT 5382]